MLGEILGVFVKTLTADDKYPVQDYENFLRPIQMQLYEKPKAFPQLLVPFLESTSNLKHFEKKMIIIANVFPKLETVKILVRSLSKKRRFRTCIHSQDVKAPKMLPISS